MVLNCYKLKADDNYLVYCCLIYVTGEVAGTFEPSSFPGLYACCLIFLKFATSWTVFKLLQLFCLLYGTGDSPFVMIVSLSSTNLAT